MLDGVIERGQGTYTIFEKLENGEPTGGGRLAIGESAREGLPAPRPAAEAPPRDGAAKSALMSFREKLGFMRRAAIPPVRGGAAAAVRRMPGRG